VLAVGIVSVIVIITWVLPNILATIGDEIVMPWPTRLLLGISNFVRGYGLILTVGIAGGIYVMRRWIKGEGRLAWDTFKLKIPIFGSVLRTIAVGRFARTLGALTKGGVAILESLGIVRDTLGNELLGRGIDETAEKVKTGSPLAAPLGETGFFPPLLVQIVSIGEQTGKLDELLLNAAETFDEAADSAITRFIAVFPAVLILALAVVIGFIIMAILLPIIMMGAGSGVF
jgi:type II secretory pathway component PulF